VFDELRKETMMGLRLRSGGMKGGKESINKKKEGEEEREIGLRLGQNRDD